MAQRRDIKGRFLAEGAKGDFINARLIINEKFHALELAVKEAARKPLHKVADKIRDEAIRSMKYVGESSEPSAPGEPPHTHTHVKSRSLPGSIKVLEYGKDRAVIGTRHYLAGLHEKGGTVNRKNQEPAVYPARPYMKPALEKVKRDMPRFFRRLQIRMK